MGVSKVGHAISKGLPPEGSKLRGVGAVENEDEPHVGIVTPAALNGSERIHRPENETRVSAVRVNLDPIAVANLP